MANETTEDRKVINSRGWVIVDGVHCCYCQLAEWACPLHGEQDSKEIWQALYAVQRGPSQSKEDNNDG